MSILETAPTLISPPLLQKIVWFWRYLLNKTQTHGQTDRQTEGQTVISRTPPPSFSTGLIIITIFQTAPTLTSLTLLQKVVWFRRHLQDNTETHRPTDRHKDKRTEFLQGHLPLASVQGLYNNSRNSSYPDFPTFVTKDCVVLKVSSRQNPDTWRQTDRQTDRRTNRQLFQGHLPLASVQGI